MTMHTYCMWKCQQGATLNPVREHWIIQNSPSALHHHHLAACHRLWKNIPTEEKWNMSSVRDFLKKKTHEKNLFLSEIEFNQLLWWSIVQAL